MNRSTPPASKSDRRQFLRAAGAAALGAPLLFDRAFAVQRRKYSCVVIGAGLAGLAAAHALKDAEWDVTVVEARGRKGGRVLSYSFESNPELVCELGAEWVGASHERLQALCRVADGGEQWIIDGLEDFLTERRHRERAIAAQVVTGLEKGLQAVDLLDKSCLAARPEAQVFPHLQQFGPCCSW